MSRERDAFDGFAPPDRGRFGDNEHAPIRGNDSVRSNLVDVKLIYVCTSRSGAAMGFAPWKGYVGPPIYLAVSQIECEPKPTMNGQQVEVTLPEWMAKKKGLI